MDSILKYIYEALKIKSGSGVCGKKYKYFPESDKELRQIIFNEYFNNGKTDLSEIDTSKVTDMSELFYDLYGYSFSTIDISGWNTSNVNNMNSMFDGCSTLKKIIGLENLNVENVKDMDFMFSGCKELSEINISKWNTKNLNFSRLMFNKCYKLKNIIGIENFKTDNIYKANSMFNSCKKLKTLDLSKWIMKKCTCINGMFKGCISLEKIDGINDWEFHEKFQIDPTSIILEDTKINRNDYPKWYK
jgi:surface protein